MSERHLPPTRARLRKARRRGEVAVSTELTAAGALAGLLAALWLAGPAMGAALHALLGLALAAPRPQPLPALAAPLLHALLQLAAPPLAGAAGGALLVGLLQTRGLFSLQRLRPDFQRLSPSNFLANLFSSQQGFSLLRLLLKVLLLGGALALWAATSMDGLLRLMNLPPQPLPGLAHSQLMRLGLGALLLLLPLAALDLLHQRHEYMKRLRMTVDEQRREFRDDEGDPQLKQQRRALARQAQTAQPGAPAGPLNGATLVLTNPTHVAVALRWVPGLTPLPLLVAKALDAAALRLRAQAEAQGIPVVAAPPLARSLFAQVELGQPIGEAWFEPVAQLLRDLPPRAEAPAAPQV